MSAIFGCVDFNGSNISQDTIDALQKPFNDFKIDRFTAERYGSAVMGCGLQYIKLWSKDETLPMIDEESGNIFTADCVIDNRGDLIAELCPTEQEIPDGDLLYRAIKKWGPDMAKKVYGCYSYALYNKAENKLVLGVDHTATRVLYYQIVGSRIYFSTRMDSVLAASQSREVNDEWIMMLVGLKSLAIHTNPIDTPYKGVKRVEAAHYNTITNNGVEAIRYWSTDDVKPIILKNDNEYKEQFLKLFARCVEEQIQGVDGEVGILLSGGFDSTTTAALAIKKLRKDNKKLHGYSHVPIDKHKIRYNVNRVMENETRTINLFCDMYPDIKPNLLPLPECDGFSNLQKNIKLYGLPFKSLTNVDWIGEMYRSAGKDNCKILLSGQYGNASISWGDMDSYFGIMIKRGKLGLAIKAMNSYCKNKKLSRKKLFFDKIKTLGRAFSGGDKDTNYLTAGYIGLNLDTAKELGISARDKRLKSNGESQSNKLYSYKEIRDLIVNPIAFAHISEPETQFSIESGLLHRDPSKDIRIIEFCHAIPLECYVNDKAETRRLVRHYCAELLPKQFLPESAPRGRQSADLVTRLLDNWDEIFIDIKNTFAKGDIYRYCDKKELDEAMERFKTIDEDKTTSTELLRFGLAYAVALFLEQEKQECKG